MLNLCTKFAFIYYLVNINSRLKDCKLKFLMPKKHMLN